MKVKSYGDLDELSSIEDFNDYEVLIIESKSGETANGKTIKLSSLIKSMLHNNKFIEKVSEVIELKLKEKEEVNG